MFEYRRYRVVPILITVGIVVTLIFAWRMFAATESGRSAAARKILSQPSEIRLSLTIDYKTGNLAQEQYMMSDIQGVSAAEYHALSRGGTLVRVEAPKRQTREYTSNVAFFFGKVVQDGIWELTNRPPRGNTSKTYTLYVYQLVSGKSGDRKMTFTDPHYWATTGGHQYHIKLDRNKPVPDLLQLKSSALIEPRYQRLVDDFENFGSLQYRITVAAQRARIVKMNK